ncbi:MAG: hypothetical protein RL757_1891 [Bacteroidota bacterium]|jgi:hypothetical protein
MDKKYLIVKENIPQLADENDLETLRNQIKNGISIENIEIYALQKPIDLSQKSAQKSNVKGLFVVLGLLVLLLAALFFWKKEAKKDAHQNKSKAVLLALETAETKLKDLKNSLEWQRSERDSLSRVAAKSDSSKTSLAAKETAAIAQLEALYAQLPRAKPAERTKLKQKEAELTQQKDALALKWQQAKENLENTKSVVEKQQKKWAQTELAAKQTQAQIDSLSQRWEVIKSEEK